jgi:hypothetical protein
MPHLPQDQLRLTPESGRVGRRYEDLGRLGLGS